MYSDGLEEHFRRSFDADVEPLRESPVSIGAQDVVLRVHSSDAEPPSRDTMVQKMTAVLGTK